MTRAWIGACGSGGRSGGSSVAVGPISAMRSCAAVAVSTRTREPLGEQFLLLVHRGQLAFGDRESLGRLRDVGIGRLDLLAQERDLPGDLVEPLRAGPQLLLGGREIVGEDLQFGTDLAQPHVGLLGRVDHGGADEHALGRDERRSRVLACFRAASSISRTR